MASRTATRKAGKAAPAAEPPEGAANATRLEILDAAGKLIVERGYDAFTMRAVAALVEIKAGSLYYHFASKDEIVEEIMNTGIATLLDQVGGALGNLPSDAGFAERFTTAVHTHISCMLGNTSHGYMHVYEHLPPVLKRRSRAMRVRYAKLWSDLFADGIQAGEVDPGTDLTLLVPYFLGGLNRVPEWFRPNRWKSADVADTAIRMLLQGILVRAPERKPAPAPRPGRPRPPRD